MTPTNMRQAAKVNQDDADDRAANGLAHRPSGGLSGGLSVRGREPQTHLFEKVVDLVLVVHGNLTCEGTEKTALGPGTVKMVEPAESVRLVVAPAVAPAVVDRAVVGSAGVVVDRVGAPAVSGAQNDVAGRAVAAGDPGL